MNAKALPVRLFLSLALAGAMACHSAPLASPDGRDMEPSWRDRSTSEGGFKAKEGGLVRVGGHLWGINGEYTGDVILVLDNGDTVIVPEYDPTFAPEVGFGYRGKIYGCDLTYKTFESEGDFGGGVDDDRWSYVDLDFKQFYRTRTRLQPYLTLGLGYFYGTIRNGTTADGLVFEDSDFSGVSLNGGVGLALYLSDRLAIDVRGIYRYAETLDVEAARVGTVSVENGLDASGYGLSFGLSYTF